MIVVMNFGLLIFLISTCLTLWIGWKIYLRFKLKKYRDDIEYYRNNLTTGESTWLKTGFKYKDHTNISFVKCKIMSINNNTKKVYVVFRDPFKPFAKGIGKSMDLKHIYPEWAIPTKYSKK